MKLSTFCFIFSLLVGAAALWSYSDARADDTVTVRVLDDSQYPDVVMRVTCTHNSPTVLVKACAAAINTLCPEGAKISDDAETPPGMVPAVLEFTVACRREAVDGV